MNEEEHEDIPNPFGVSSTELVSLNETREHNMLEQRGGLVGIAEALKTNLKDGVAAEETDADFEARKRVFGTNEYPQSEPNSLLFYIWDAFKDITLIILVVAAAVSLIVGLLATFLPQEKPEPEEWTMGEGCEAGGAAGGAHKNEWLDSVGIFIAVVLVTGVTAFNNWSKDRQFRSLNKVKEDRNVRVIRGGEEREISILDIVVGDVVILEGGDQIPADGLFIEGFNLQADESVMTGETEMVHHSPENPFMLSGCQISDGVGNMLVTSVGVNTEWGQTMQNLKKEDENTPLQDKLEHLASLIGYVGMAVAVLDFIVLLILFCVKTYSDWQGPKEDFRLDQLVQMLRFLVIAVTIVVVAIPEGLPLAVTISLAYSMKKMMKDNNLVRHLSACETMGGATNICSDKTGTLTTNRMEVIEGWFGGSKYAQVPSSENLNPTFYQLLCDSIAINSKAHLVTDTPGLPEFLGNKTECGMLYMLYKDFKEDYKATRLKYEEDVAQVYTFSSDRKRMSTVLKTGDDNYRIYTKGASEIVLGLCSRYMGNDGNVADISPDKREELDEEITQMASRGLRTIAIAYKDFSLEDPQVLEDPQYDPEDDLTLLAVVGIKDPLRPDVIEAVSRCKKSGIIVRMVTGDNILTAKHIAKECGVLTENGTAMLGKDFRELSDEELDNVLPRLQVLARSTPTDKLILVNALKKRRQVVAVTGDGTNDAAALKAANVGLSMGLSGTEVAKEASDIIILDDNFKSIVMTVKWGRSVYENIRKFLQFQVTINFVALIVTFVGSISTLGFPLTPVQLLWVNLIMDTFAALALATEPPADELLDRKPYGKDDALITTAMWKNIIVQGLYQIAILFLILYGFDTVVPQQGKHWSCREGSKDFTFLFNVFVFCQLFNELNCRKINDELNVFTRLHKSWAFVGIWIFTAGFQSLIIQFGGGVAQTTGLEAYEWAMCFVFGLVAIPLGFLLRLIRLPELQEYYFRGKRVDMKMEESDGHEHPMHQISAD
eukprot:gb/GECH01011784.1/.p1 GENE.gb/GECH01011784.1/~~gb/GECH01011784.1/.p1  ORF type:complete len:1002 (+),score=264.50 gb/GECH01011784.1/:1-3006(+)